MTSAPSRTILLTGATGQIGWELRHTLAPLGRVVVLRRADADLAQPAQLRDVARAFQPQIIVNAAAYTAVDLAESHRETATAVNARAPGVLAEEAARLGALMVQYSTDYVFDGAKRSPYVEDDTMAPLSVYGETKLAGERAVRAVSGQHLIVRTSWVYANHGRNFLRTILRLSREGKELRVVDDQIGTPTPARLVAEATAHLVSRVDAALSGTYHVATRGSTSWYGFAKAIRELDPARAEHRCERIIPIMSSGFPTPARRPAFSVLDTGKVEAAFGLRMPEWRDGLALVMEDSEGSVLVRDVSSSLEGAARRLHT